MSYRGTPTLMELLDRLGGFEPEISGPINPPKPTKKERLAAGIFRAATDLSLPPQSCPCPPWVACGCMTKNTE